MAKKNNKGFSLIEVIVAVAVFAILIVPLTTQLISAININTRSTKKQYAIEKAEEIMESFKTADLSGSAISIPDGNSTGNYDFTVTGTENKTQSLPGSETVDYTIKTYSCNGISLGGEYEKYNCTVTVNDIAYAVSAKGYIWDSEKQKLKQEGSEYVKTPSAVGTVRNLDDKQSAIIVGATYTTLGATGNSLDNKAYSHFMDQKLDILKKDYPVRYNQYLSTGADYFSNDTFKKTTTIKITKNSSGYRITCSVEYIDQPELNIYAEADDAVYKPEGRYEPGVVYQKDYEELPPVYLLYTPAVYGKNYCDSDYITVDVSGLDSSDCAKVYIFQSMAEIDSKYETIICDALGVSDISKLVYHNEEATSSVESVKVRADLIGDASQVEAYSNFSLDDANCTLSVKGTADDVSDDTYLYDVTVELTDSKGNKTTVSGTRGK